MSKGLAKLLTTQIDDVEFFVETVKEHRLAIVMRGPGLGAALTGTDPQKTGVSPLPVRALKPDSEKTARRRESVHRTGAQVVGGSSSPANMILVRGFDKYPDLPAFPELFGLRAAAIAVNPTYRGIAKLVGMQVLKVDGGTLADEFTTLEKNWNDFDFFYLHVKNTDIAGEDGDFARKVRVIEEVDALMPRLIGARAGRGHCQRRSLDPGSAQITFVASCADTAVQPVRPRRWHRRIRRTRVRARRAGRIAGKGHDADRVGKRAAHHQVQRVNYRRGMCDMSTSNAYSSDVFSATLFEKMKRINPGDRGYGTL